MDEQLDDREQSLLRQRLHEAVPVTAGWRTSARTVALRGRRRHQRAVVALAAAAVVMVGGVAYGAGAVLDDGRGSAPLVAAPGDAETDGPDPTAAGPDAGVHLNVAPRPSDISFEALVRGTLAVSPEGCVHLTGGGVSDVVWPFGYDVEVADDGTVVLLDETGAVVAREGERLRGAGGLVPAPDDLTCRAGSGEVIAWGYAMGG